MIQQQMSYETRQMIEKIKIVGIVIFLITNCFIFYKLKPILATKIEWFNTFELFSINSLIIVLVLTGIVVIALFTGYLAKYSICELYTCVIYTFIPNKNIGWIILTFAVAFLIFSVWMYFTRYYNIPLNKKEYKIQTSIGALPCIFLLMVGLFLCELRIGWIIGISICITILISVIMWFIMNLIIKIYYKRHREEFENVEQPQQQATQQEKHKESAKFNQANKNTQEKQQKEQPQERTQLENALALYMFDDIKDVTEDELKKQRNRLVKMYHPDNSDASERYVQKINEAYELIKSNVK